MGKRWSWEGILISMVQEEEVEEEDKLGGKRGLEMGFHFRL